MTVTIGMPYYGCPEVVEKAVRSVLAQTYRDLVLVVIGDGEAVPSLAVTDSRLVIYNLPENRGAYFAQQLILQATPHAWYGPVAADDWIEPNHVETLMALGSTVNVPEAVCIHLLDGTTLIQKSLWEVGVFAVERLKAIGGYSPAERIEQDMLMMKLLRRTGPTAQSPEITYHQVKRQGSLTMTPATGLTSKYRRQRRMVNSRLLHDLQRMKFEPASIRKHRESLVPAEIRSELAGHVEKLRELL